MTNIIKFMTSIILVLLIFYFHKQYENLTGRCYESLTGKEKLINDDGTCYNYWYCFNGIPNPQNNDNNECEQKNKQYCYDCDNGYTLDNVRHVCLDVTGKHQYLEDGMDISDLDFTTTGTVEDSTTTNTVDDSTTTNVAFVPLIEKVD